MLKLLQLLGGGGGGACGRLISPRHLRRKNLARICEATEERLVFASINYADHSVAPRCIQGTYGGGASGERASFLRSLSLPTPAAHKNMSAKKKNLKHCLSEDRQCLGIFHARKILYSALGMGLRAQKETTTGHFAIIIWIIAARINGVVSSCIYGIKNIEHLYFKAFYGITVCKSVGKRRLMCRLDWRLYCGCLIESTRVALLKFCSVIFSKKWWEGW